MIKIDDLKKKALDAKRISLTQKHEVAYLRKKARELITLCKKEMKIQGVKHTAVFLIRHKQYPSNSDFAEFPLSTMERLCKALLLCLKKRK